MSSAATIMCGQREGSDTRHNAKTVRKTRAGGRASKYLIFDAPIAPQKRSSVLCLARPLALCLSVPVKSAARADFSLLSRVLSSLSTPLSPSAVLPTAAGGVSPSSTSTPLKLKSPLDSLSLSPSEVYKHQSFLGPSMQSVAVFFQCK